MRELQDLLSVPIDGDFGSETYSTLRIVQRAHDLVPDGICGPMTWAALTSEPYCSELRGVDVSGFTSLTPEQWRTYFERDKYRFAIARLTTGRAPDEKGPGHLQNASGAGFTLLGGYGWLRGDQDAEEQAAVLIEACDRVENKIGIPISTWIDAEDRSSAEPWPRAAYARTCVDVFTILREKRPMSGTYIGPWFAKQIRHAAPQALATLAEGPLWISDYTPPVDLISEWSAWTIWQMKGGTFDRLRRRRRIFQKIAPLNEVQEDGAVGGLGSKEEKKEIRDREILRSEIGGARLGSVVRSPKIDLR